MARGRGSRFPDLMTIHEYDVPETRRADARPRIQLPRSLSGDLPFTRSMAMDAGLTDNHLSSLVRQGAFKRPLRGIYAPATCEDTISFRVACLALVVPGDTIVTDRSAGWLHGAQMILAPGSHRAVPRVTVFRPASHGRLRRQTARSGERTLADDEIVEFGSIRATSPLRTALDLGRFLPRAQALSALDMMLRLEQFTLHELLADIERLRGQRGVRQLRTLAPLADRRSQSPGESALRLAWIDAGLPSPDLQIPVDVPGGGTFFIDLGIEELGYAAEYDGAEFHTSPKQQRHDRHRRKLMTRHDGWSIDVFLAEHVYGVRANAIERLKAGYDAARRTYETRRLGG